MTQFKKGQSGNLKGKPKGTVSEKTKFWHELKGFMINEGAEKYKSELMKLKGKDFINSFALLLEYFEPKLSRAEVKHGVSQEAFDQEFIKGIADKINKNAAS